MVVRDMNIDGFDAGRVETDRGAVFVQKGGTGPVVLLLHGFPETSLMWRDVAPLLAAEFTVVAADLPGYGRSDPPPDSDDHSAMSKREMATLLVAAMQQLDCERFAIMGHDRGGRVGYRAALDHPGSVTRLAVLDVIPTYEVWARADVRLTLAFWPFSLLAQPAPLGERLLSAAPDAVVDDASAHWGSPAHAFSPDIREAYIDALRDPARAHAICEEYRAAASIDRSHDEIDLDAGRRIECPVLALWSAAGAFGILVRRCGRAACDLAAMGRKRQRSTDCGWAFLPRGASPSHGGVARSFPPRRVRGVCGTKSLTAVSFRQHSKAAGLLSTPSGGSWAVHPNRRSWPTQDLPLWTAAYSSR